MKFHLLLAAGFTILALAGCTQPEPIIDADTVYTGKYSPPPQPAPRIIWPEPPCVFLGRTDPLLAEQQCEDEPVEITTRSPEPEPRPEPECTAGDRCGQEH